MAPIGFLAGMLVMRAFLDDLIGERSDVADEVENLSRLVHNNAKSHTDAGMWEACGWASCENARTTILELRGVL